MIVKLAVILLSFAVASCAFTCDPQNPQVADHCQKPAKDSNKPSIGCCHGINGVVKKAADVCMANLLWTTEPAVPQSLTELPDIAVRQGLGASPSVTHVILRA